MIPKKKKNRKAYDDGWYDASNLLLHYTIFFVKQAASHLKLMSKDKSDRHKYWYCEGFNRRILKAERDKSRPEG